MKVLRWVSQMLSAFEQDIGVGSLLVSVNTIEGPATSLITAGAVIRVTLFVSPVKPTWSQVGGIAPIPLFTAVLTTMVDAALKVASDELPSPITLNSEIRQPLVRSGKRLSPAEE